MTNKTTKEWEEDLILNLIRLGRNYEPCFFASMIEKVLWALEDTDSQGGQK